MRKLWGVLLFASIFNGSLAAEDLSRQKLRVGFVIVEGVYNTELTAPMDVFQHTIFHRQPGMEVFTVAPSMDTITTFEGLRIVPDYTFRTAPEVDVLVVPSAKHSMGSDLKNQEMMAYVRQAGEKADFVLSLCDGAFVLAAAGLLEGRKSTTFPADIARFKEMFPGLDVIEDVSFVHHGSAITSAGGARSFDAALYLVEMIYGKNAADGIARGLVIDWNKDKVAHLVVKE